MSDKPLRLFVRIEDLCEGRVTATTYPFPGAVEYAQSSERLPDTPVVDYVSHYGILDAGGGTVYMQRKGALNATDDPMKAHELVIVALCEALLGRAQSASGEKFEAAGWIDPEQFKPDDGQDVLIYHCLGDSRRGDHAYDVACWTNGKWIFPWDRAGNPNPRWVVAWRAIEPCEE